MENNIEITADEVIATLKNTSLPTIVVEGNDDMIVYREIEDRLSSIGVSVLPIGGRGKILEVFLRRSELPSASRPIFIADKDTWVITGIPIEYIDNSMVFTHGYSIENDIYIDGDLRKLLRGNECIIFQRELEEYIEWYALAIMRFLNNQNQSISIHPNQVLDPVERPRFMALSPGETYPETLRLNILQNYSSHLRGKSLLNLLVRNTNYRERSTRHNKNSLLETVAVRPGALLNQIYSRVEQYFLQEHISTHLQ